MPNRYDQETRHWTLAEFFRTDSNNQDGLSNFAPSLMRDPNRVLAALQQGPVTIPIEPGSTQYNLRVNTEGRPLDPQGNVGYVTMQLSGSDSIDIKFQYFAYYELPKKKGGLGGLLGSLGGAAIGTTIAPGIGTTIGAQLGGTAGNLGETLADGGPSGVTASSLSIPATYRGFSANSVATPAFGDIYTNPQIQQTAPLDWKPLALIVVLAVAGGMLVARQVRR